MKEKAKAKREDEDKSEIAKPRNQWREKDFDCVRFLLSSLYLKLK